MIGRWLPSSIRERLIFLFVSGGLGVLILGGSVVYFSGLDTIQETLGNTYCQIASRIVSTFEERFHNTNRFVRDISLDSLTTEVALEVNQQYRNRPSEWIQARKQRLSDEWETTIGEGERADLLHSALSRRLSVMAGLHGNIIERVSVYDRHGILFAASLPPARRLVADTDWFVAVSERQEQFTYFDLDGVTGRLNLVLPVWGGAQIIGFLWAEFYPSGFTASVYDIGFGKTGTAVMVDANGTPLLENDDRPVIEGGASLMPTSMEGINHEPYWFAASDDTGWRTWNRLACIAPFSSLNSMKGSFPLPSWYVVVTQSPDESYAALQSSLGNFALVGVVGIFIIGFGGAYMALRITSPIKELQDGIHLFAQGARDRRTPISEVTEIGALAEEFNRMADRITTSENELKAFAQAVAGAADAIIMTDPKGKIYYANPAFETVTGYTAQEVMGETPSVLRASSTTEDIYIGMWQAIRDGQSWRGELWNRRENGETYPAELSISPIIDDEGTVVSLIGIQRDITLAREYQESLEREVKARTQEIAETEGLTVMGRMASMIAHDLRNPLSTIKMNLQILLRNFVEADQAETEHCQLGLDQVRYMEEILRDMLSFARPEKMKGDWYDLPKIIDESLAAMAHEIDEYDIQVDRPEDKGLPKVFCDKIKVMEALRNLIDNAIQAMPKGGHLTIYNFIIVGGEDPMVQVSVQDTGDGIKPEVMESLFEPFFTTRAKGTGLGLAIVKRIIDQHGGEFSVESEVGAGATFTFSLPTSPFETSA